MYPLICKKAVLESQMESEEQIINEMCQFDTERYPYIKKDKFNYEFQGDLIVITYKIYQTESQQASKVDLFKKNGYTIWNSDETVYLQEVK